jgi:hypothetical protein
MNGGPHVTSCGRFGSVWRSRDLKSHRGDLVELKRLVGAGSDGEECGRGVSDKRRPRNTFVRWKMSQLTQCDAVRPLETAGHVIYGSLMESPRWDLGA